MVIFLLKASSLALQELFVVSQRRREFYYFSKFWIEVFAYLPAYGGMTGQEAFYEFVYNDCGEKI